MKNVLAVAAAALALNGATVWPGTAQKNSNVTA
jgi:hypothetical protein